MTKFPDEDSARLSRRALLAVPVGATATLGAIPSLAGAEDCIPLCNLWMAREAEQMRLFRRLDEAEEALFRHHKWSLLTPEEREALPAAAALRAVQAQLNDLSELRQSLASRLPRSRATNREGVMLKFEVVNRELHIDDFPAIHGLLKSAVRDLAALW
jgi:hypothetical protein